jgi:hypothetical protein
LGLNKDFSESKKVELEKVKKELNEFSQKHQKDLENLKLIHTQELYIAKKLEKK